MNRCNWIANGPAARQVLALLLFMSTLAACTATSMGRLTQNTAAAPRPGQAQALPKVQVAVTPYFLQIGDVLDIKFFHNKELNQNVVVRPDGKFSIEPIGEVRAAGLTPDKLQDALRERYSTILKRPVVTVIVRQFSPTRYYVGGEVAKPGEHELRPGTTVLQAIIRSGGFAPDAEGRNVIVLRHTAEQRPQFYALNLEAYLDGGLARVSQVESCAENDDCPPPAAGTYAQNLRGDLVLQAYDVVFVPKTTIGSLAQFFSRYLSAILPVYQNFGLTLVYDLDDHDGL